MSADNGYVIRQRRDGLWTMQMYFASSDDHPLIDETPNAVVYSDPMQALAVYESWEDLNGFVSEYGPHIEGGTHEQKELSLQILAELPDGCWVFRDMPGTSCISLIGGQLGNAKWQWSMCCLPCRVRAVAKA